MNRKSLSNWKRKIKQSGWYSGLRQLRNDLKFVVDQIGPRPRIGSTSTDYDMYWRDKRADGTLGKPGGFQIARAKWILPRIDAGDTVAEFGCGDAATLAALMMAKAIKGIGLDISAYALSFAEKNGIETVLMEQGEIDFDRLPEADAYLLLEVIEHFPNPEQALKRILQKSRKKVFISIPNTGFFPYRLRLLMGKFPVQWRLHPSEHLRFWTLADFHWWLDQLGLSQSCTVIAYRGIPGLNRLMPNIFGMGILCEIRK